MKRLLFILGTIVAAVAAMTTSAAASTPATVDFIQCGSGGGQVTVPAGSTVAFQGTWISLYLGQDYAFLHDVTVPASLDGTQITNTNSYWGAPQAIPADSKSGVIFAMQWTYPTGITLGAGQSLTFTTDWVLVHPISAIGFGPPPAVTPAGSVLGGPITCTVTGT